MATIRPFAALRPADGMAEKIAALQYDVYNRKEAKEAVKDAPHSFLRIDRAETTLPDDVDTYDERVYKRAKELLTEQVEKGEYITEDKPCFYLYELVMNGRSQTGVVGCASIDDYCRNVIKKHENTRADKEEDRIRHVDTLSAQTGPIFLAYRDRADLQALIKKGKEEKPLYDFTAEDGITHRIYRIADEGMQEEIARIFKEMDSLYIADGHHRAASAVKVGKKRREQNPGYTGNEEFNFFLAVLFAQSELAIMDYNRVIKDLNGLTQDEFIAKISESFTVESAPESPYKPQDKHTFGMYLGGKWYKLTAKDGTFDASDPVAALDVSILQQNLISPVLGIDDPRTDKRIDFVGGIRGLKELERRAQSDMCLAFSMFPTTVDDLMDIADAGKIMPPKSTWFEPKLLSGLFVHKLK